MNIYVQLLLGMQALSALLSFAAFTVRPIMERERHSHQFVLACIGLAMWTPVVGRLVGWW